MSYINETDFVIENKELVYPEVITDGLQLYYDAKGKRDTDYHRDTMLDMSGNNNHGKLQNFAYEKHSGYKDGLVFDYIDDKLVRPELNLKPDDFTFMLNGNIISFSSDGTVKRVQDGEVIESKGFNIIKNGDFSDGINGWGQSVENEAVVNGNEVTITTSKRGRFGLWYSYNKEGLKYISAEFYSEDVMGAFTLGNAQVFASTSNGIWSRVSTVNSDSGIIRFYADSGEDSHYKIRKPIIINLTETFGAGNEPTKEQMDEIINQFGFIPNAQDLIDRIEYKGNTLGDMENIIDGLYKTEVLSGEEIFTDKADDDAGVHVEVDGKSYQHAGSGKNLLEGISQESQSANSVNDNGLYFPVDLNKYADGEEYTISFEAMQTNPSDRLHYGVARNAGNTTINMGTTLFTTTYKRYYETFTFTEGVEANGVWFVNRIANYPNNTGDVYVRNLQLEEGSTATEYEPPAPTPDYPIEIHSLNDFDVVSSVGKRNLVTYSNEFRRGSTAGGSIVPSINDEGHLVVETVGGSSQNWHRQWVSANTDLTKITNSFEVGDEFTVSFTMKSPNSKDLPTVYMGAGDSYHRLVGKLDNEFSTVYYSGHWRASGSVIPYLGFANIAGKYIIKDWKVEKGSTATPYSPAPEDITENDSHPLIDKTNLLLDEPLRSVGDVKDRLFRDSDGIWKIERNVGEVTLDGSEQWVFRGSALNGLFVYNIDPFANGDFPNNSHALSSHFEYLGASGLGRFLDSSKVGFGLYNNPENSHHANFYLVSNQDSIHDLKAWFGDNNVTVHYQKFTSSIETLDQELQDKLNNLRSFEDSNYVYTVLPNKNNHVSENLKPTLHAKFLYNNWYKEDRVINNLMIYNRALTNEEMLQNYKTIKRRWGM